VKHLGCSVFSFTSRKIVCAMNICQMWYMSVNWRKPFQDLLSVTGIKT